MRAHCVQQRAQRLRTSPGMLPSTGGIIDRALRKPGASFNLRHHLGQACHHGIDDKGSETRL